MPVPAVTRFAKLLSDEAESRVKNLCSAKNEVIHYLYSESINTCNSQQSLWLTLEQAWLECCGVMLSVTYGSYLVAVSQKQSVPREQCVCYR